MSTAPAIGSTSPLNAIDAVASRWFFRGLLAGAAFLASAQYAIRSLPDVDPPAKAAPASGAPSGNPIPSSLPPPLSSSVR